MRVTSTAATGSSTTTSTPDAYDEVARARVGQGRVAASGAPVSTVVMGEVVSARRRGLRRARLGVRGPDRDRRPTRA